jgi:hypothetical protein
MPKRRGGRTHSLMIILKKLRNQKTNAAKDFFFSLQNIFEFQIATIASKTVIKRVGMRVITFN